MPTLRNLETIWGSKTNEQTAAEYWDAILCFCNFRTNK